MIKNGVHGKLMLKWKAGWCFKRPSVQTHIGWALITTWSKTVSCNQISLFLKADCWRLLKSRRFCSCVKPWLRAPQPALRAAVQRRSHSKQYIFHGGRHLEVGWWPQAAGQPWRWAAGTARAGTSPRAKDQQRPPRRPRRPPLFPPGCAAGGARAPPCEGSTVAFPGPALPADKMAAPMELSCWGGDWGLPSLHPESLTVMVMAGAATSSGRRATGREARCRGLPGARVAVPGCSRREGGAATEGRPEAGRGLCRARGTAAAHEAARHGSRGGGGPGCERGRAGPGRARREPPGRGPRCAVTGGGVRRRYRAARNAEISFVLIGYCTSLQGALTRTLKNRSLLLVQKRRRA